MISLLVLSLSERNSCPIIVKNASTASIGGGGGGKTGSAGNYTGGCDVFRASVNLSIASSLVLLFFRFDD